jgi:hypothetical protein
MGIWVHLNHPCLEIDVWRNVLPEDEEAAIGQGYIPLEKLRELVESSPEARIAGTILAAGIWQGWGKFVGNNSEPAPFDGLAHLIGLPLAFEEEE